jgi:hypothetical protein
MTLQGAVVFVLLIACALLVSRRGNSLRNTARPSMSDKVRGAFNTQWTPIMSDYFATIQVPVLRGREFNARDSAAATPVILINSTLAQRFWPNENPMESVAPRCSLAAFLRGAPRRLIRSLLFAATKVTEPLGVASNESNAQSENEKGERPKVCPSPFSLFTESQLR